MTANVAVHWAVIALFLLVAALVARGAYTFHQSEASHPGGPKPLQQVNPRLEVLWTSIAAVLLLALFIAAR